MMDRQTSGQVGRETDTYRRNSRKSKLSFLSRDWELDFSRRGFFKRKISRTTICYEGAWFHFVFIKRFRYYLMQFSRLCSANRLCTPVKISSSWR